MVGAGAGECGCREGIAFEGVDRRWDPREAGRHGDG